MKNKEFEGFVGKFRKAQDKLILAKGHDYTQGNPDRLHNFKEVARLTGLTAMQVWSVYWLKHVFAICTYVKYGKVKSEGIDERFLDEANYNLLGKAILADESKHRRPANKRKSRQALSKVWRSKGTKCKSKSHGRT